MGRGYSIEVFPTGDDKGLVEAFDNEDDKIVYLSGGDEEFRYAIEEARESIEAEIIRKKK